MRIVAYDLGTNTFRWFFGVYASGRFLRTQGGRRIVGIGRGLREEGRIAPQDLERALELAKLWRQGAGVVPQGERACAIATHAFRVASNGEEARMRLEEALGVEVRVITPEEEAQLAFLGIWEGLAGRLVPAGYRGEEGGRGFPPFPGVPQPSLPLAFLDIGGGSSEVGYAIPGKLLKVQSIPVGVVTRRARAHEPLGVVYERVKKEFLESLSPLGKPALQGLGVNCGTSTALAMLFTGKPYSPEGLHRVFVPRAWFEGWIAAHASHTPEDLERTPLGPERAELIAPGVAILSAILEAFELPGFWNSETGLLEGFAASLAEEGAFAPQGCAERERG